MRVLPRSLFGRLVLVLFGGLIAAQLLSAAILFAERDRLLLHASGMRPAQRIADIVRLLDSVGPAERARIVAVLGGPRERVVLDRPAPPRDAAGSRNAHEAMLLAALHAALGEERPLRVVVREAPGPGSPGAWAMPGMQRMRHPVMSVTTQVRLADGSWVSFDANLPRAAADFPQRLLLDLGVLLAAVLVLSFVAVRWLTRPLAVLAEAADDLGRNLRRPPLPETGPAELRRAAHAFNSMQARLARFIDDRVRVLGAMSHDLKTPLTRMRLRAELLEDDELRARFEKDLGEMEAMVVQALDFLRGLDAGEAPAPIDVMALLESLQADNEEMGRPMRIEGRALAPYPGSASALRRCIANLIDNAILYGRSARVVVEDGAKSITLRVLDEGPGIPQQELANVFEPFYRLEASRSRETGGSGLGLAIARNIARAHGGDIALSNRPGGGLEAVLSLPRKG
ncbi:MAG: hypothetical protein OHK0026_09770 [Rhodocyclaceae bacterium]